MAWNAPRTWVDNEVVSALTMRRHIRDNLTALSLHEHSGSAGDGADINTLTFGSVYSTAGDPPGTAPSFRATSNATSAGATSVSVTKPTGTVENDILIAAVSVESSTVYGYLSGGWTQIGPGALSAGNISTTWWWKRAGASEPASYTVTSQPSTSVAWNVNITAFDGCILAGVPYEGLVSGVEYPGTTSHDRASPVSTTGANRLLVTMVHGDSSSATWTAPSGFSEHYDTQNNNSSITLASKTQASAGSSGTFAATSSSTITSSMMSFALVPEQPT